MNSTISKPSVFRAWVVCLTASTLFFYVFVIITMFNSIDPSLMQAFSISADKIGKLSGAFFYIECLLVFPAGLLLDRFSTKLVILLCFILCVISLFLFSMTNSYDLAFLYRSIMGIAGAFALLSGLRLVTRWFPPQKMAFISGCVITMGFLGGMVSQTPMTLLVEQIGWRHSMQWTAVLGIVFIVLTLLFIKDYPRNFPREASSRTSLLGLWHSIKNAVMHYQNWLFGLYTGLVNLPIWVLGAAWGTLFLMQGLHFSAKQSSYVMSLLFFGAMIGSPIFGWLSDKMGSRKKPMILGAVLSLLVMLSIMYWIHISLIGEMTLFFLLGFITSSQVISYPAIAESNPDETVGGALGLSSTLILGGGAVFPPLFGLLMDESWNHKIAHHVPVYSLHDYRTAMWILPIAFFASIVIACVIRETYQVKS